MPDSPEVVDDGAAASDGPRSNEPARRARGRWWVTALKWLVACFALCALAYTLRSADLSTTLVLVKRLGARAFWVLVPYAVGTWLHALAWQRLVPRRVVTGQRPPVRALFGVLLSAEAIRMTFPAGVAFGESTSVMLLHERYGVPASEAVASIGAKKALVTVTNGLIVLLALALGWSTLTAGSTRLFGASWILIALFVGSAVTLFAIAGSMSVALASKKTVHRLARLLGRLPIARLRRYLAERAHQIEGADSKLAAPFAKGRRVDLFAAGVLVLLQWFAETAETVLVLRLLGVPLDLVSGFVCEICGSLIRSFAFVLPGGLGLQDAGYVTMFDALSGTQLATLGAAFVLVKRAKELVFIAIGYLLLLLGRRASRSTSSVGESDSSANDATKPASETGAKSRI